MGVEHAIRRLLDALQNGHKFIWILDLKGAYPSVQRAQLIEVLRKRLPRNLVNMVAVLLKADTISTVGDKSVAEGKIATGVLEGSPVSPTLFNLYIDTLGRRVVDMPRHISAWPANLFADDLMLLANSSDVLQRELDTCTTWAREFGLTWAPSKSCVIVTKETVYRFMLADAEIA